MIRKSDGILSHYRVETSERCAAKNGNQGYHSPTNSPRGCQVHVAIASTFSTNQIIKPTEVLLRKFFVRFGTLLDVQVNYYNVGTSPVSDYLPGRV